MAAEETAVDRKRRGVYGLQNAVARGVGNGPLALRVAAPEHVDDALPALVDGLHDGVGEGLPAVARMRGGLVLAYGEHRVEQQHPLLGPAVKVAARGVGRPRVVAHLLEDVLQRRREGDAVAHREAEPVGLPRTVVGVLPDDDHLEPLEGALVEGAEDVAAARIDASRGVLLAHEAGQLGEIGLLELGFEDGFPIGGDSYIHDVSPVFAE